MGKVLFLAGDFHRNSYHVMIEPPFHEEGLEGYYYPAADYEALQAKLAEALDMLKILLSVKITDSDGNVALGISETRYQEARAFLARMED